MNNEERQIYASYQGAQERSMATGKIEPMTPAVLYNLEGELITVPLITLAAWVVGLRGVVKHGIDSFNVLPPIRAHLKASEPYKAIWILDHLEEAKRQTEAFYAGGNTQADREYDNVD